MTLQVDKRVYTIGSGIWEGAKRSFHGENVELRQADSWCMTANYMDYEGATNLYTWSQPVTIDGQDGKGGKFHIEAEKLLFNPVNLEWTASENVSLKWQRSSNQVSYAMTTTVANFDDNISKIVFPSRVDFSGNGFSGTSDSAVANAGMITTNAIKINIDKQIISANTANLSEQRLVFTGDVVAQSSERELMANEASMLVDQQAMTFTQVKGTLNRHINFSADVVHATSTGFTAEGAVTLQRNDTLLSCDQLISKEGNKVYTAIGNIRYNLSKGIQLLADEMILNDATRQASFVQVRILQEEGESISGEKATYDEMTRIFTVEQNIVARAKSGRETKADKAWYDMDKRALKFAGHIKSSK